MPNGPIITNAMSSVIPNNQNNVPANNNSNNDSIPNGKGKAIAYKTSLIGKNSNSTTPLFLLTFDIFNRNIHNCMVDSGASSNFIPFPVCRRLNAKFTPCETQITQLYHSNVKVLGEMKDV